MFYNTIHATGRQLEAFQNDTEKQEQLIYEIMKTAKKGLRPSQVHTILWGYGYRMPITSVRRSMTNLTRKKKKLVMTRTMFMGPYGRPEHVWRVAQ